MADINIRFRMNLKTGLRDIIIEYEKDDDAMRHEHEKRHREIVKKLVGEGILNADEVGEIKVERLTGAEQAPTATEQGEGEAQATQQ